MPPIKMVKLKMLDPIFLLTFPCFSQHFLIFRGFTPLLKFLTVKILLSLAYFQKAPTLKTKNRMMITIGLKL